ncbi:MAG: NAD(P)H-dependent oxidoreductase [Clostridia bacterium]|nr:NAD(P)H-dependent oxidoreductase [Clostridia bacterium]
MPKILFVNGCARENSRTLELAEYAMSFLSGDRETVDLYKIPLSPLDTAGIELRATASQNKDYTNKSFDLAKQFSSADTIVVAAPYWDLMFPAVIKSYFESITVNGLTFVYGDNGIPKGLCKAQNIIYITTSGGPIIHNFGYEYVAALARSFYGIKDVKFISAQGLDIKGADVNSIMSKAKESIKNSL